MYMKLSINEKIELAYDQPSAQVNIEIKFIDENGKDISFNRFQIDDLLNGTYEIRLNLVQKSDQRPCGFTTMEIGCWSNKIVNYHGPFWLKKDLQLGDLDIFQLFPNVDGDCMYMFRIWKTEPIKRAEATNLAPGGTSQCFRITDHRQGMISRLPNA
ncbi:hypothetical protein BGW36DRAFT_354376 [Talaromyces proteolyticus]|uniref:Uncharacterized protein n=1 Tax=Talaromyces proteolyticus TaxID=1131652 RepID=A0AAD4L1U1_9EURO|nr:uncharacterized protein BGW36DRAFT_354376 [Talaromyces proteolyticus]KAH8705993.1 hypothetical protein BGW36DRAFT_354376 [Talaromyces proteolyticus]